MNNYGGIMVKRFVAVFLVCVMILTGCKSSENNSAVNTNKEKNTDEINQVLEDSDISFDGMDDPELLQYIEDDIYSDLIYRFDSEDYIVEDISTIYISKEYLEEIEYNSKENIYFGYTLSEIDEQFEGTRYVFSLGEDGNTIVQEFEEYNNTYEKILKNIAIGTGVILVCVTISVVSGGAGMTTISTVFATSATKATEYALCSGICSGIAAGVVTQYQTDDLDEAIKEAMLQGSEGFKWGAISGAIEGGVTKALSLRKNSKKIPTPRESELRVLKKYGGDEQVSFLNGEQVSMATRNATRPDVVRYTDGVLEAIEVKNYNLDSATSRSTLYKELERQVTDRVQNLPKGSKQRIVLDVKGRGYSDDLIENVISNIRLKCADVYPNIPIDILR